MKNRDSPYFSQLAAFIVALALSSSVLAQSSKVYRVGMLDIQSAAANRTNLDAFLRGLKEAGYVEGRNLVIDYRSAEGRSDRFVELASDLVRAKPDVIVTRGTPAALAAKKAGSIPVVMAAIADPIASKVVTSLSRPGGQVTGLTTIINELHGKRLELIKELLPSAKRVGYIFNPNNPNAFIVSKELGRRAQAIGLEVQIVEATSAEALNRALEASIAKGVEVLLLSAEAVLVANESAIIDFAAKKKLPAMYSTREFVEKGGLISYGVDYAHLYYRAASYVAKILKGAKPGDLPIEQPSKFELVVNLRTAKTLGIHFSREFLARTDDAIQ